ncbi:MAG: exodeoxyribonuclease VII small subunit [Candidatus Pacebacteria bacterium]|nr:exodeoxyribonuclease VII small subunit [Candidatus Paceibacterota bacterium]
MTKSSFATDFKELEKLVEEFEKGEIDIEQGMIKFKKGLGLARSLKKRLSQVENEIVKIKEEFEDLDPDSEDKKEIAVLKKTKSAQK